MPWGEADVLLGMDPFETARAIGLDPALRVAHADRTRIVANIGSLDERLGAEDLAPRIAAFLRPFGNEGVRLLDDVAQSCREVFQTDRLVDLVLLGAAFQLGLIPVSVEAIETSVRRLEQRGIGRSLDALLYGRRLAAGGARPRRATADGEEVGRLLRLYTRGLSRSRRGGRQLAHRFERLVQETLLRTPGLAETDSGRQARRDLVAALRRCVTWGGIEYASRFAQLIAQLYEADRADHGRDLTCLSIFPLADAMLIRDPVYLASMAVSFEHRRRTRQRLNVKPARGDRLERRYMNRFEIVALGRRLRLEIRTSDWPARLIARAGSLIPRRIRGTRAERRVRAVIEDFVDRAATEAPRDYRRWHAALRLLHDHARETRLQGVSARELRSMLEMQLSGGRDGDGA